MLLLLLRLRLRLRLRLPCVLAVAVLVVRHCRAHAADALWVQPSGHWYGIDGTWSTFTFGVGSPPQAVDLIPSTNLSEMWVVETTGCVQVQLCYTARGGVYNMSSSATWQPLGPFQRGLGYVGIAGNGDYGLDSVIWENTLTSMKTGVQGGLVAGINDTDAYQGLVGLGMSQSKFNDNKLTNSLLIQLTEQYGIIPSYSYGFTAGAHYINGGVQASLTLGGYDALRFRAHATNFTLDPAVRVPIVLLRGVTATVSSMADAPGANWTSTSRSLMAMNESVTAVIDSSTPYLWLPPAVCDRFAAALKLVWSEDFGVYLFSDASQYIQYTNGTSLSLTFSLSSYDNGDDFGLPLAGPGVVNITISAPAFAQLFRYPFKNLIGFGASAVPYFPLTRAPSARQYVIGRAFLQEAYLITRYEEGIFGLYEAEFPANPGTNLSVRPIPRPDDSPYPAYSGATSPSGPKAGKTAGIVLGAFATGSLVAVFLALGCRRRTAEPTHDGTAPDENKEAESDHVEQPVFPTLAPCTGARKAAPHEVHGSTAQPTEVGADAHHAVYELPVPLEPAELDSTRDGGDDMTEPETERPAASELARRKVERQLMGPVPTYTPSSAPEKPIQDTSPVPHYRPARVPCPPSCPTYKSHGESTHGHVPSPVSPHPAGTNGTFDLPSPLTLAPPIASPPRCSPPSPPASQTSFAVRIPRPGPPSPWGGSDSAGVSPVSPADLPMPPPPSALQRTPLDPSRVICLGPRRGNFTAVEAAQEPRTLPEPADEDGDPDAHPRSPRSMERIEAGAELVHVPQVAEKRYSWEEPRPHGH